VVAKDPEIFGSTAVFRGARVPLQNLLDHLEGGETLAEFLPDFPTLTREAAIAALKRVKALLVDTLGGRFSWTNAFFGNSNLTYLFTSAEPYPKRGLPARKMEFCCARPKQKTMTRW
jgi:uncharacterized protein (DUF433 family)